MRRDRLIRIERATDGAEDGFGESVFVWTLVSNEWASRKDVSDSQKVTAGMEFSAMAARFVVRSNDKTRTITTKDRINGESGFGTL